MRIAAKTIIAVSFLGFLNALYLTIIFLEKTLGQSKQPSFCDINNQFSCSNIITSSYGKFLGVPVCTVALVVYPAIIILAYLAIKKRRPRNYFYAISILAGMGMMLNVVYLYNEFVYLGAICLLCSVCLVVIATDLVASIVGYLKS